MIYSIGQVNIDTEQLSSFLEASASLKIRGLEHMLKQAKSVEEGFIDKLKIEEKKTEGPPLKKAKMSDLSPPKRYQPETEDIDGFSLKERCFMMDEIDNTMNLEVEELSMVLLKEESFSDTEEMNGGVKQYEAEKVKLLPEEREEEDGDFAETDGVTATSNIPEEDGFSDFEESSEKVLQTEAEKLKDFPNKVGSDCNADPSKSTKSCPNPQKGKKFTLVGSDFSHLILFIYFICLLFLQSL